MAYASRLDVTYDYLEQMTQGSEGLQLRVYEAGRGRRSQNSRLEDPLTPS